MQKLLNFDVSIHSRDGGRYTCVAASPVGEAHADFALPFTDKDLQILILQVLTSVGRVRRKARRIQSPERQLLEHFGGQLFQAVFSGAVRNFLDRSLSAAESENAGLRIRLRLPPELANIPWEYLYDRESAGFVGLSPDTVLVRYVEMPGPLRPFPISPPLRILAMISAPTDVPELQGDDEWAKLNAALTDLTDRGMVQADRLEAGTLAALQLPLRQREYHVLHFVGHGKYDEDAQDGALALEAEDGRMRLVTGRDLGVMLRGHRSLRLVVLNACEGARSARDDPFGGVAQALVRQGIPAVIAMQFEVSDPAALVFSQSFYQAIADGLPVDLAMVEARKTMFAAGNEVEWATPVLYLRSPDGQVFIRGQIPEADRQAQEKAGQEAPEETDAFDPIQQGMPAATHDEQDNYENPEGSDAVRDLRLSPEEWERRAAKLRARHEAHRRQVEESRKADEEEPATALGAMPGAVTSSSTPGAALTGTLASDAALAAPREELSGGFNLTEQGQATDRYTKGIEQPDSNKPVGKDLDRAARLFAYAERIANSIIYAVPKAAALSSVAEALAATDPDRAARLFAYAERIANAITTDKYEKAAALSSVANALAATGPDRAEHIANSIPDKSAKAAALSSVAKTLAATDPDRAERIANSIPYKSGKAAALGSAAAQALLTPGPGIITAVPKAAALSSVAQALAATDPGRAARLFADAERIANSIITAVPKAAALSSVAQALAATDPARAARLFADAERAANSIPDKSGKIAALSSLAAALAATDPARAERIANSTADKSVKAAALSSVAKTLAATDPDRAERIANSIPTDKYEKAAALGSAAAQALWHLSPGIITAVPKATALSSVAQALAATDPGRAARLFADAERIANSITSETGKASALSSVAKTLAATDPDRAERIANSIPDKSAKAEALSSVAETLAATDPDRAVRLFADAERIANSITSETGKASALSSLAKALAATSLQTSRSRPRALAERSPARQVPRTAWNRIVSLGTGLSCLSDRYLAGQSPPWVDCEWPSSTGSDPPIGARNVVDTGPTTALVTVTHRTTPGLMVR